MHFLPDRNWVLILPDNSDGSSHRVASGLLPDGNAEADGECGVVEVNDQLRQMQANPVEIGPPGVCVQYLGVLLLAPSTFTCHTQTTEKYFLGYSPTHTKHRKVLLLAQFVFTCHLHKTSHQEVQSMHLHLQVPCFAYISSIYPVLHTFHLYTLFFIDFSEIGAPPTDKGEVFSW